MGFNQLPNQRQANAKAFPLVRGMLMRGLTEQVEYTIQILFRQSDPVIDKL